MVSVCIWIERHLRQLVGGAYKHEPSHINLVYATTGISPLGSHRSKRSLCLPATVDRADRQRSRFCRFGCDLQAVRKVLPAKRKWI